MTGEHVAAALYREIGSEAFAAVARWLLAGASEWNVETGDGRNAPASVAWLAGAVRFYDPNRNVAS